MKKCTVMIFVLLMLVGCSQDKVGHQAELEQWIEAIAADQDNGVIEVAALTDFEWDKALLFPPYTTQESLNEQLGVTFKDPSHIDTRDDIYLLVFLKDNKVTQYVEIVRQQANFSISGAEYLTHSSATIHITR